MNLVQKPFFFLKDYGQMNRGLEYFYVTHATFSFFNHGKEYRTWTPVAKRFHGKIMLNVTKKHLYTMQILKM